MRSPSHHAGRACGAPYGLTFLLTQSCGKASSCKRIIQDRLPYAPRQPISGLQARGPCWMPLLPGAFASIGAKGSLLTDTCFPDPDRSPDILPNSDNSNVHSLRGFYSG